MTEAFEKLAERAEQEWAAFARPTERTQIAVGMGIHGLAAGGPDVIEAIKAALAKAGAEADIRMRSAALGFDYAEVIVSIARPNGPRVYFANVTPDSAAALVESYAAGGAIPDGADVLGAIGDVEVGGPPDLFSREEFSLQRRVATQNCGVIEPDNLWHYIANGGYAALDKAVSGMSPEDVIGEIEKSNLRGRGGAAFPAAMKWKFLIGAPGPPKYHLCNAEEGDSGAFNDKHLLESDPFRVIEGITIAGYATKAGGGKGFIFIRTGWDLPIDRVQRALDTAYEHGLLGKDILGTGFDFDIEISLTGESYVSGEETALMEAVEGKRAMPRYKPPFPAAAGLWQKPSNINNVKTYSYAPSIVANGGDWFAGIGTERSKGTALVCLSGRVNRPGLYEVPFGVTLREVIEVLGGGVPGGKALKFLQTGGPLGGFLPASSLDMPIDFDAMIAAGAMFGSGGIIVGDETDSVIEIAAVLGEFNAEESCGKCFPCRLGTRQIANILDRLEHKKATRKELDTALVIGETMKSALCAHGHLAENPIKSGYRYFQDEFEASIQEGAAQAG